MKITRALTAVLFLSGFFYAGSLAQAAEVTLLTPTLRQGQTVIASFSEKPAAVAFDGVSVNVFPFRSGWRIAVPLTLTATTGAHNLKATFANSSVEKMVTVLRSRAPVVVLPVPEKLQQTPKQLVTNLAKTNTGISSVVTATSSITRFTTTFGLPLANNRNVTSVFGEVRQTGTERITHLGVDFGVPKGTAVAAINGGLVAASYLDPVYGNSVIIDHGQGIYSLYLHLDSRNVSKDLNVKKGKLIGRVGDSGLADAPHLHLSIKINGQSVDPLQFVGSFR